MEETDLPHALSLAKETANVCPDHLEKWLRPYLSKPNHRSRVLLFNDTVPVGGLVGHLDMGLYNGEKRAVIAFVYIDPDYRLGLVPFKLLLTDFESWAREAGATGIVAANNSHAIMRRMGYSPFETWHIKRL